MITFRPHTKEDIPLRVKWLNNPKANKFAVENFEHKTNIQEQTKWFEDYEKDNSKKFFTILENEQPVGFIGLSKIDQTKECANVFILIGEDRARGKGIGKESLNYLINYAFEKLGLSSLELEVPKENDTAIALYKKIGFKINTENDKEHEMTLTLKR